jgi:hypothetical protein
MSYLSGRCSEPVQRATRLVARSGNGRSFYCGTDGSNLVRSSRESGANLSFPAAPGVHSRRLSLLKQRILQRLAHDCTLKPIGHYAVGTQTNWIEIVDLK